MTRSAKHEPRDRGSSRPPRRTQRMVPSFQFRIWRNEGIFKETLIFFAREL